MSPADVVRSVNEMPGSSLERRRPSKIDLSDIPERPLGEDAVRGKYTHVFRQFPLVEIDPDRHEAFPSAAHVNDALRNLLRVAGEQPHSYRWRPLGAEKTRLRLTDPANTAKC